MNRKDFVNGLKDFKTYEEVINGVKVVHTENTEFSPGKYLRSESIEMYDANGNSFYSNCSSREIAQKVIEELEAEGKKAVIGPKAPGDDNGKLISNQRKNWVGIYIVKEKEESRDRD